MVAETPDLDLRARLLQAARDELAEHGYGQLSLRAIARRTGVSHAAPAYSFGDRAGLLTAVVAQGFRELARDLDAPFGAGEDPLAVLGRRYVGFAQRNPALYELMFRPDEFNAANEELAEARIAALRRLTIVTAGEEKAPTALTLVSWALAHGVATLGSQGALRTVAEAVDPAGLIDAYALLVSPS